MKPKTGSKFPASQRRIRVTACPTVLSRSLRLAWLGGALGASLPAMPAWAQSDAQASHPAGQQQQAQPASSPASQASQPQQLEAVVVTAQKRTERLKDVPISVQVLDTEKMASQGQVKLADFFAEVPGLGYVSNSMSSTLVIRGIATDSGINVRPTVGVVVDDVPYGSAANTGVIPDLDPSDLRRVEVLRGPQGTLYGASSMGGLVKYVMNDPDTRTPSRRVEVGANSVSHGAAGYVGRFAMNQPLGDSFAIRVSAFRRKDPGYVHNLNSDERNDSIVQGGRIAGIWKVTPDITVRASTLFQDATTDASSSVDFGYDLVPKYGDYTHNRMVGTDSSKARSQVSTLKVSADVGFGTLDSITGYNINRQSALQDVSYTAIGSAAPMFNNLFHLGLVNAGAVLDNRYDSDTVTQELRLSSKDTGALQWLVGGFYSSEHVKSKQNFYLGEKLEAKIIQDPALLTAQGDNKYRSTAVFGDVTYKFTDRFDLQVGGRFSHGKNDVTADNGGAITTPATTTNSNTDNVSTYLFSSRYKFDKDLMGFFRAASGFRAGGSNTSIPGSSIPPTFKSDTLKSYELGMKGSFLDNHLSLDAAVFRIDWDNLQVSQVDLTFGASYTTNAGTARSQGIELSGVWLPAENWRLTGSYALNDAKLTSDIPGFVEGQTAFGRSGDRLPYSARQSFAASVTRYFQLADGRDWFVGASANLVGSRDMEFVQSSTVPRIHLPGYATYALNAGMHGTNWTLTFFVRNLTDERAYLNASRRAPSLSSGTTATLSGPLIQPRTVGATLSWDL